MVKAGDHVRDESDAGNVGDAWLVGCGVIKVVRVMLVMDDAGGAGDVGNG